MSEWLKSIKDDDVREIAAEDAIITGGAIASMLLGEQVNDFDIYFRTKKTTKIVAEYYVRQFNKKHKLKVSKGVNPYQPEVREETQTNCKGITEERIVIWMQSAGVAGEVQKQYSYFENMNEEAAKDFAESTAKKIKKTKEKYRPVFMSQNAITLSGKIQLIIRFYGEPDEIHDNYDYVHAMNYWDNGTEELNLHPESIEALLSRTLVYKGSLYPIASIFRLKKFIERGWRITAGQQLKIMWQISELDLTDKSVLREQLIGVDMAYMHQLIRALHDIEPEKICSSYVATIIDRIFD
ncbi:MAG: hypothetical protein GY829_14915, partial [Gammaproteobacteria bacterium]|nr:hypothetical protein [Gammaproteobacteria bacterium]